MSVGRVRRTSFLDSVPAGYPQRWEMSMGMDTVGGWMAQARADEQLSQCAG